MKTILIRTYLYLCSSNCDNSISLNSDIRASYQSAKVSNSFHPILKIVNLELQSLKARNENLDFSTLASGTLGYQKVPFQKLEPS